MQKNHDLNQIRVDSLDSAQPLGRFLILLFQQFETSLLQKLSLNGYQDISPSQINLLRFIPMEGISITYLAQLGGVSKQAASKTLESIRLKGWVEKRVSPKDRRESVIVFTPKGRDFLQQTVQIISGIEAEYEHVLGQESFARLKADLKALHDHHKESHHES